MIGCWQPEELHQHPGVGAATHKQAHGSHSKQGAEEVEARLRGRRRRRGRRKSVGLDMTCGVILRVPAFSTWPQQTSAWFASSIVLQSLSPRPQIPPAAPTAGNQSRWVFLIMGGSRIFFRGGGLKNYLGVEPLVNTQVHRSIGRLI